MPGAPKVEPVFPRNAPVRNNLVEPLTRLRFRRHMRLLTAGDYARVFQRAERSGSRALTVLARQSGRNNARLGLAIPRKQIRRAAERNRVKRLIRESFRHHQELLRGLDVVVVARADLAKKNSQCMFRCLEKHWQQVSTRCRDAGAD
jgi:ribonuclease P protein component